ncbi:hypothetical protein NYV52_01530 [Escherichia coli]|nr:hypothetical protein [Escherichia coli]
MKLPQRAALENSARRKGWRMMPSSPTDPRRNRLSPEETMATGPPVSPKRANCKVRLETPHPEAPVTAKLKPGPTDGTTSPSSAPEKAPVSAQPQQPDTRRKSRPASSAPVKV